jgi:hypothetical protein
LAAENAERREQWLLQQQQKLESDIALVAAQQQVAERELDDRRDALRVQQEEFGWQTAAWEAALRQEESRLAEEAKRLEAEGARLAATAAGLDSQREAIEERLARPASESPDLQAQLAQGLDADGSGLADQRTDFELETGKSLTSLRESRTAGGRRGRPMTRQEQARLQELALIRSLRGKQGEEGTSRSAAASQGPDEEEALTTLRATWRQTATDEPESQPHGRIFSYLASTACLIAIGTFIWWRYVA